MTPILVLWLVADHPLVLAAKFNVMSAVNMKDTHKSGIMLSTRANRPQ